MYEHRYGLEESKGRIDDFVYVVAWMAFDDDSEEIQKNFNIAQNELEFGFNCIVLFNCPFNLHVFRLEITESSVLVRAVLDNLYPRDAAQMPRSEARIHTLQQQNLNSPNSQPRTATPTHNRDGYRVRFCPSPDESFSILSSIHLCKSMSFSYAGRPMSALHQFLSV